MRGEGGRGRRGARRALWVCFSVNKVSRKTAGGSVHLKIYFFIFIYHIKGEIIYFSYI